ncbi:phosphatase PAP2 family protein [Vibrio sp. F74]|uniref:phosphatase PAP2 family protein n=1 Tax=Vibrio sp. F74 TaxID=700020 RepID=UPI0035F57D20
MRKALRAYVLSLYQDKSFYILIAFNILLTKLIFGIYDIKTKLSLSLYSVIFGAAGQIILFSLIIYYIFYLVVKRPVSPLTVLFNCVMKPLRTPNILATFLTQLFFINIMLSCYTSIKSTIGTVFPFRFDEYFLMLDNYIHLGFQPWQYTHFIFSSSYATAIINIIYNSWFFVVWITLFYFMCQTTLIRKKFLIGFSLCWIIIGGFFAILMSSAGPCFLENININHDLTLNLFQRLEMQNKMLIDNDWPPLWSIATQEHLWQEHVTSVTSLGSGISAMPSMHVSISVFMTLSVYIIHKIVGILFGLFTIAIFIGSIHLGWHYAVDGYVSFILTFLIWFGINHKYK